MARLRGGYGEPSEWLGKAKAGGRKLEAGLRRSAILSGRTESSTVGQDFIASQVKTDGGGGRLSVEKVGEHCLSYVFSQRLPVIGLGENRLAEAFGNKAAVRFLGDFKDDFHSI